MNHRTTYNWIARTIAIISSLLLVMTAAPPARAADAQWRARYWNNTDFSGDPVKDRMEDKINYNWGSDRPVSGVNKDGFSVRWTRTVAFDKAGTYSFEMTTDDGGRLYVDDKLVIDKWYNHPAETYTANVQLSKGDHKIKMEYYEDGGDAVAKLTWGMAYNGWKGEYYDNKKLTGDPVLVRDDANIDFNWGTGKPASGAGLSSDNFSVRWTRTVNFAAGTYRFTMSTDDGARLYVDGNKVLDKWSDHTASPETVDVALTAGNHTIKLEYYEATGSASARLTWGLATPTPSPTPAPGAQKLEATTPLNVRTGPAITYTKLGVIVPGNFYNVTGSQGGWWKIDWNGQAGWVSGAYSRVTGGSVPTTPTPAPGGSTTGQTLEALLGLNVRSGPGTSYPRLGIIYPRTSYPVTGKQGSWYSISYLGKTGWVYGPYVTLKGGTTTTPTPSTPTVNFRADSTSIKKGQCTTLRWDVEGVWSVYYQSTGVVGHSSAQECPTATTTYNLDVIHVGGQPQRYTVTVNVTN